MRQSGLGIGPTINFCTYPAPSPITYDFTFHVHISRFHWDFFIFYLMRNAVAANRKQIVNIATRGTICDRTNPAPYTVANPMVVKVATSVVPFLFISVALHNVELVQRISS